MGQVFQPRSPRTGRPYSIWHIRYWDPSQRREIKESSHSPSRRVAVRLVAQREAEAAARPNPFPDRRRRLAHAADGTRRGARGRQAHGLTALRRAVEALGTRAIDPQTALGQALNEWRNLLMTDLGGAEVVTTAQRQVIDVAVKTKLLLDSIDGWLFQQPRLVNGRTRSCFPVVGQRNQIANALVSHLQILGLERRKLEPKSLPDYLAERYPGPANGQTASPAARPAGGAAP